MHTEVKKCAENNDIKGLRYIFVDCLDVDPTFEKYKEDYEYCKKISGFLEEYVELTPLNSNKLQWDNEYWGRLKLDLMKNFSLRRFEHMIEVAKVVYAEKRSRLEEERRRIEEAKQKLELDNQRIKEEQHMQSEQIKDYRQADMQSKPSNGNISAQAAEDRRIEEAKRKLELDNQRFEERRKQEERIEAARKAEQAKRNSYKESTDSKKWLGIGMIILIVVIIILLIKVLL